MTERLTSETAVVVIGGGSTGCGIARDLSMRGVDVTLVEKGTLTNGTTGRMHGLLHSGARYADSDPESASECIAEKDVLGQIASHCVEETGGLFVKRPENSSEYFERKRRACRACGIPATVLTGAEAREVEPYLASDVDAAIRVPDAAVDPFRLCVANAAAAESNGARIETHATVTDVLVTDGRVTGVEVAHETGPGTRVHGAPSAIERIEADHVVNATGAWAGRIGKMADVEIDVRPSKGAMTVTNVRGIDTVINWCRPKGDADIIQPHETTAILGTTDVPVDDPEDFSEEQWEVDLLVEELSALVPKLREARTLRSYWGVRPLYEPPGTDTEETRDITRRFFLLDHGARDDRPGLTSVVGGKLTTYRLMAEQVSDHVCDRLGVDATCRTHEVPLPGSERPARLDAHMADYGVRSPIATQSARRLGSRTRAVLDTGDDPNPVVCECEAVTRAEVEDAIRTSGSDLNAVRIRTRASMGNCQGGFCAHRLATILGESYDDATVRKAFVELLAERWKGVRHALWGEQLAQVSLNRLLWMTTMNVGGDPATTTGEGNDSVDYAEFAGGNGATTRTASNSEDAVFGPKGDGERNGESTDNDPQPDGGTRGDR